MYIFGCLQNSVQIELLQILQIEAYSANSTYETKAFRVAWPSSLPKYFNRNELPWAQLK